MYLLVIWLLAVSCSVAAEEKSKPLTNADVIKMLENKIPESVIVAKIQASEVNFDTSTDAIIELHNTGVTENMLNAMLKPHAGLSGAAKSPDAPPLGNAKPPEQPPPPPAATGGEQPSGLAYGPATRVKKGVTTQVEIMERFGSPDVMTTDKDGTEVWMYDKTTSTVSSKSSGASQSEASAMAGFLGIPFIAGVGGAKESGKSQSEQSGEVKRSSKTITFIIKFNEDKTVKDYAVRQATY